MWQEIETVVILNGDQTPDHIVKHIWSTPMSCSRMCGFITSTGTHQVLDGSGIISQVSMSLTLRCSRCSVTLRASPRKLGESPNATVRYLTSRGRSFSDRSLNPSSIYAPKRGIVTIARPQQATAPSLPLQQIPLQSVMEKQATQVRQASHATMGVVAEQEPVVHDIYEEKTGTWQYIVADPSTLEAVIIDPVLDYDSASSEILTTTADSLLDMVHQNKYKVQMILETHAHADHLTAANYLQHKLAEIQGTAPAVGIGKRIADVQKLWAGRYGVPSEEYESVFDKLFDDNEVFHIGSLKSVAIHLPGHTPDHMGYMIGGKGTLATMKQP